MKFKDMVHYELSIIKTDYRNHALGNYGKLKYVDIDDIDVLKQKYLDIVQSLSVELSDYYIYYYCDGLSTNKTVALKMNCTERCVKNYNRRLIEEIKRRLSI